MVPWVVVRVWTCIGVERLRPSCSNIGFELGTFGLSWDVGFVMGIKGLRPIFLEPVACGVRGVVGAFGLMCSFVILLGSTFSFTALNLY